MFSFLNDAFNYGYRKVARYDGKDFEQNDISIDTCRVSDSEEYPYETAIASNKYNNGDWVIYKRYGNKEEAKIGHRQVVQEFTENPLPDEIKGLFAGTLGDLIGAMSETEYEIFKKKV